MAEINKIIYNGTEYQIGAGWSPQAISLLETILTSAAYDSDQSTNISALISELSRSEGVTVTFLNHVLSLTGFSNTPTMTIT